MTAEFSPCGTYRYALYRALWPEQPPYVDRNDTTVLFVMLNPSTAGAVEDDATIRRCLSFARREGFARLAVGNLFALRATDPGELERHDDPVGPRNEWWLDHLIRNADLIVAAWGASPFARARAERVWPLLLTAPSPVQCLGVTQAGSPCHPLRLPANRPLEAYELERAA